MVTPDEAIDAIRDAGGARPGYRALHAKGKLYRGTFIASPEAAQVSRAAHLNGSTVPALIRFSSGSGNPAQRDGMPGVRGMAVKFMLPDGSTTDVSTHDGKTVPVEYTRWLRRAVARHATWHRSTASPRRIRRDASAPAGDVARTA